MQRVSYALNEFRIHGSTLKGPPSHANRALEQVAIIKSRDQSMLKVDAITT